MSGAVGAAVDSLSIVANRFALVRPLEESVYSATWLGSDQHASDAPSPAAATQVVVKQIKQRGSPDAAVERSFELQLLQYRDQRFAGLPTLIDHGWDGSRRYMVFEWCGDQPLADISAVDMAKLPRADERQKGRYHDRTRRATH